MKYFLIALVLVAGIAGIFVLSSRKSNLASNISPTVTPTTTEQKTLSSLRDLLASETPQNCTFLTEINGTPSQGNVFVSANKMRGDFDSQIDGKTVKSHMIVADNTSYLWSEGQNQGIKVEFDESDLENADEFAEQAKLDVNAELDYDCDTWIPDNTVFQIPSEVQFTSLDEMMKALPTGSSEQCAQCESLTGDSKTQCLTALKCN